MSTPCRNVRVVKGGQHMFRSFPILSYCIDILPILLCFDEPDIAVTYLHTNAVR